VSLCALTQIGRREIELRIVDTLWPLRDLAHRKPRDFSTVRMGNARPRDGLA